MHSRDILLAIALIISLPILVAGLGTSAGAGIAIGVALMVIGGVVWWYGSRRPEDGG